MVQWRIEIDLIDDPAFADEPYAAGRLRRRRPPTPAPGGTRATSTCTPSHSNPGDATMRETFDYAFCPDPALGALCAAPESQPGGLDFITLSDYVTTRQLGRDRSPSRATTPAS